MHGYATLDIRAFPHQTSARDKRSPSIPGTAFPNQCRRAEGTIEFDSGDVAMQFSVVDAGGPQLVVHDAAIAFADISLEATGSRLSWLYNALLALFHDQIVTRIQDRMSAALQDDVPAKLNSYLAALPSTVRVPAPPQPRLGPLSSPLEHLCSFARWYSAGRHPEL